MRRILIGWLACSGLMGCPASKSAVESERPEPAFTSNSQAQAEVVDEKPGEDTRRAYLEEGVKLALDTETVTTRDIMRAYRNNELAADAQFKGKWASISGKVATIGKDMMDDPYIAFEGPILGSVQCFLAPESVDKAAKISPGEIAFVIGKGEGKFGNVLFRDCLVGTKR